MVLALLLHSVQTKAEIYGHENETIGNITSVAVCGRIETQARWEDARLLHVGQVQV